MPDPFAEFAGAASKEEQPQMPPVSPPGGDTGMAGSDPFAEFAGAAGGGGPVAPPIDMTPRFAPPKEEDQPILGLPKEMFGMKTTDIPLAGFFLNQRMYQGPTQEEQAQYKPEQPKTYNPLQPLGINAPISSDTPIIGGLAQALGEAQKPTQPDYFSAGIRDIPILGEASRAGEAALNLLNQSYKTVGEPLAGLASIPLRGLSKISAGPEAMGAEAQKAADEALSRMVAAGGIDRPDNIVKEIGAIQEFGRAALAGTPAAYKFSAPIVFDPLTYAGGGLSKAERANLTARTGVDVAEIAKMSPLERIAKTGMITSPVSKSAVEAAGEMGVLSKSALGMKPNNLLQEVIPWNYTNRSKAFELFENSVSGLLARSQFTDASKTAELLDAFARAAKEGSFAPIAEQFPDMVKAARSFEGERMIRSLGGLDTSRHKAVLNAIPENIAEMMKAVETGALGEKPSQFAKDFFDALMSGAPKDKKAADLLKTRLAEGQDMKDLVTQAANDYAKYKMLADASDSMAKVALDSYKITNDERLLVKIRDTIKSLEANLFIGFSPTTVINNYVNNTVTQALHGLNPFGISKYADRMWNAWKIEPGGAFRKIQSDALAQMSRGQKVAGFGGLVKGRQFGPFLKMYSKMEEGARMNIWAKGTEDYFKKAMQMSANSMPDSVATALRALDPSGALLDTVKGAIRSSFTPDEIMGFVRGKLPVTLEAHSAEIAKAMGISENTFQAVMHQSEVWPEINDALKSAKSAEEFKTQAVKILDELKSRIERGRKLQAETTGTALPKLVKAELDNAVKAVQPIKAGVAGTIHTIEDIKAQSIPFEQFNVPRNKSSVWIAENHFGESEKTISAIYKNVGKWEEQGTTRENWIKSVNKAREQGKLWPDALTKMYQEQANWSFQHLSDPGVSMTSARRAWYEGNLRESDSLMRILNDNKKGLDFEQLAKGPTNPELGWGGRLGTERKYVAEYTKRAQGAVPQVPAGGAGPGISGPIPTGGVPSAGGGPAVPNAPGTGGVPGVVGTPAVGGAADPAFKQAITNYPDAALQFWSTLKGEQWRGYADAARELLAERGASAAGGGPAIGGAPSPVKRAAGFVPSEAVGETAKVISGEIPQFAKVEGALGKGLQDTNGIGTYVLTDGTVYHSNPLSRNFGVSGKDELMTSEGTLVSRSALSEVRDANGKLLWSKAGPPETAKGGVQFRELSSAESKAADEALARQKSAQELADIRASGQQPIDIRPKGAPIESAAPESVQIPEDLKNSIQGLRDAAGESANATGMQADELIAAQYKPIADVIETLYPKLDSLYAAASKFEQPGPQSEAARAALEGWVRGDLTASMTDARIAAARIGDWYVQRNILNYSARTNFDDWLSWAFPFAYWPRATASNYLMEAINRPALITNYVRSKEMLDKIQKDQGFPARFKGAIPVPMPFASSVPWLGGKLFFDPLKDWLPIDRFTTEPAKMFGYLQPNSSDVANEIRTRMQSGEISAAQGEQALKQQKGNSIWDTTEARLRQQQQPDPLDIGSLIFSPHFPLDWANKLMQGRPQDISYLIPMSRQVKGLSAIAQSMFPQLNIPSGLQGPEGKGSGLDLEGALRQKLGLPAGDSTVNYRIDRMLASMALDGSVPVDKARIARIERKGPVYEEAVRRATLETGIGSISGLFMFNSRVMAGGEQIAMNDAKQVSNLVDSLVQGAGGDPVKMSYDEKKALLKDTKGEGGKPLWDQVSKWYQDHPEYKSRLELFDTVEGRLSNWLSDQIWEKYLGMSALDRRMFSEQNPDFKAQFASKETRQKPENIPNSLLEKWATAIGGYVPQTQAPTSLSVAEQVALALQKIQDAPEKYRPQDPKLAKQYGEYLSHYNAVSKLPAYQEYQKRLEQVRDIQNKYFDLPKPEQRAFLAQHPELKEYWDWSRNLKQNDPTVKDYFAWETEFWKTHQELAKLLGRDATTPKVSYIPYSSGGGGGGGGGYRASTFTSRRATTTTSSSEAAWNAMVKELGGPNGPLVYKVETWLTMEPGNGSIYASKNPDLAAWLSTKSQAYLNALRASYLYRLKHQPATVQGKKQFNIRYLRPVR